MSSQVKSNYPSSTAMTITLASLATDSNLLAGRQSTIIDNSSNLYEDYGVSGQIMTGTSPTTGKTIEVWAFAAYSMSAGYLDTFSTTDANRSPTSRDILTAGSALIASMTTDSSNNRGYVFKLTSIGNLFGFMPNAFGIYVVHNTGVNLNATGGNHFIHANPYYRTIV